MSPDKKARQTQIDQNSILICALNSLLHPISIAAVLLLLFNDHWLRYVSPSWWTGKLGDFAWLVFAPFICAIPLAWILPKRFKRQSWLVGCLSVLIIGLWFTLAKTMPVVHSLTTAAWETVIGWKGTQRLDPTDLITLPALLLSLAIWKSSQRRAFRYSQYGWVLLAVGVVGTLASDGPIYTYIDRGVTTICTQGDHLVVYHIDGAHYLGNATPYSKIDATQGKKTTVPNSNNQVFVEVGVYRSDDGGLTWGKEIRNGNVLSMPDDFPAELETTDNPEKFNKQPGCSKPETALTDPKDSNLQYRWTPAQSIARSTDGGKTWKVDFDLYELRQDVRRYFKPPEREDYGMGNDVRPGPLSGLIDPVTRNVVLAMGWNGVLTRTNDGVWHWASVLGYELDTLSLDKAPNILGAECWLTAALIVLVTTTATAYIRRASWLRKIIIGIGWLGWLLLAIKVVPYAHLKIASDDDFLVLEIGGILCLLAIPMIIGSLFDLIRNLRRYILPIFAVGISAAVLYLLPFVLWSIGTIPPYNTALVFSLILTGASLFAGYRYLRPRLPVIAKKPTTEKVESQ